MKRHNKLTTLPAFAVLLVGCKDDGDRGVATAGTASSATATAGDDGTGDGGTAGTDGSGDDGGDDGGDGADDANPEPMECTTPDDAGGFTFDKIAAWRDDAVSAYSMIHDDMCGPALAGIEDLAVPALSDRGLVAALGPFVQACDDAAMWGTVQDAQALGNEIVNHSYTHPEINSGNSDMEVAQAKADFDAQLDTPVEFYIFPFDYFTPETIAAVEAAGHIGARAGNRDDNDGFDNPPINTASPGNDLEIEFDVWPRTYSKYASWQAADILSVHVWNAIEAGGWAVREFHSVSPDENPPEDGSQGFGPVPVTVYEQHLDFLLDAWEQNQVWTAGPSTVIRYRHARTACSASLSGSTISYDTSDPDCTKYATPISVIVTTGNDVASLEATQGGDLVPTRKLTASTYSVTADPTKGDVELQGCADPGPEVKSGSLDPKPSPADSVCDLETVVGTGSPGCMDDLERDEAEFQALPNPSQCDGRTGSWSWYPQNATVEMFDDSGNKVLRYAGTNLAAWSGTTLAFLGGNGAGTCYDASAYTGIRFRIRGSVTSSDELNGKTILSVVTAETQTKNYGGDLDGMGGHFHKQVDVTGTWQTVSIAFTELDAPTWGDTMSLPGVADGKLQALDWGVSNMASDFEIFIDDVELY